MLQPKRTKFRKQMKGRMTGKAYRGSDVSFGDYALQATQCGRLTARPGLLAHAAQHVARRDARVE